jgi:nucleotide-binding universal stress UspA family protein
MYRSLLVPLDGSSFGEHALPLALAIARRAGARLEAVHVHQPVWYAEGKVPLHDAFDASRRTDEGAYLRQLVKRLQAVADVPVTSALLTGPVEDLLGRYGGDGLMVLATHGRGPLSRFWRASVANELVRRAGRPLLLIRSQEGDIDLTREPTVGHVLVPLDGSPLAEQVLEPAAALARLMGVEVTLLHATPLAASGVPGESPERLTAEAEEYLEAVAVRLCDRGLSVRTLVVTGRHPAGAILEVAASLPGGLIAMTTRGRGGLSQLLLGSITDTVVRGAAGPVMLLRPNALSGQPDKLPSAPYSGERGRG